MRHAIQRGCVVLALGLAPFVATPAVAASAMTGAVLLSQDHRELTLANLNPPLDDPTKAGCAGTDCDQLYGFEYQGLDQPPADLPRVLSATARDSTEVVFTLSKPYVATPDVVFGTKMQVQTAGGPKRVKGEFAIEPSLGFIASVPRLRGRLFYKALEPIPAASIESIPRMAVVTVKDTDTGQLYSRRVVQAEAPGTTHTVVLHLDRPLPNRNVAVTIGGLGGAAPSVKVKAAAVTKDSARVYIGGQYVANHDGDDALALEYKLKLLTRAIGTSQFDFGLLTEGNVGSDSLKKPDTLRTALELRYWLPSRQPGWSETSIPLFAEYVSDKKGDNQQLGMGLWFEPTIPSFTRNTLAMKKLWMPAALSAKQRFGWSFVPRVGLEAGTSLRSSSEEVEGDSYFRAVGTAGLLLQVGSVSLDTTYQMRQLFSDELTVSKTGVARVDKGFRDYLRSELAWQSGILKFSAKVEIGEVPPAFKTAGVTTLGIAVVF